jgi:hypothetical protein
LISTDYGLVSRFLAIGRPDDAETLRYRDRLVSVMVKSVSCGTPARISHTLGKSDGVAAVPVPTLLDAALCMCSDFFSEYETLTSDESHDPTFGGFEVVHYRVTFAAHLTRPRSGQRGLLGRP